MKFSKIAKSIMILLLISLSVQSQTIDSIQSGKFKMPFNNKGDFSQFGNGYSTFDDFQVIYSSGFVITGKNQDTMWLAKEFAASRGLDFLPGTYQTKNEDSLNVIYKVSKNDSPFGEAWQKYKGAVKQGADFYDGNKNGIYDPIDLNNNGKWDLNEDKPYLIGDETYVYTYHDGVKSNDRENPDQKPVGIEITNYVYKFSGDDNLDNIIFIRYQIKNNGMCGSLFDSVYFGIWNDADIVDYIDDLSGCDTVTNSAFTYSKNKDTEENSFALLTQLIQTPIAESRNANSLAIDYTPMIKSDSIQGFQNQKMNSFLSGFAHYTLGITYPNTERLVCINGLYANDLKFYGPCSLYGIFYGEHCESVDLHYTYSGDPFYLTGWVDDMDLDQRYLQTTGPFQLEVNKPQNIIVAYMAQADSLPLLAVKHIKQKARWIKTYYPYILSGEYFEDQNNIDSTNTEEINYDFVLYQNYPNPFNPETTIKFNIEGHSTSASDQSESVTLKIFDILGREVQTLLDEKLSPGIHEVNFDGSKLSSGVYFYSLRQGAKFTQRKMLLLK